ncbi:enoyl-CoA hydratase/isomerase [Hyphomonas polymorpha PS728]|uniref:3-hydroxyisobutyryl-CoA hydrolase n=1 Tax=Hyphomonas polymorpha PS728 TaxID=1280954 RepID=A0A062VJ74_9PROT|nr:enoyl-CoA hydratase/isomerase family protein [Hyphomonas polymorpha]KCZ99659.1 enoyl-CoA hydratase/isomerase [Hyphomonas polymorpha PS728]
MSQRSVIAGKQGRTGRLTLNRPEALHALNSDMVPLITDALLAWEGDEDVDLVVVDHAEGTRGFCAGGDVRMLAESGKGSGREAVEFFAAEYRLNTLIKEYDKPYVSLLDGVTMGGGVGISVNGQIRIATANTIFAMPESGIGLFPDVGGGWFLPRLEGAIGMWLALTGARLKGKDVLAAGIATHFVEDASGIAEALCAKGLAALEGFETSARISGYQHLSEMEACFSKGAVEDIMAALDAGSDWAKAQSDVLAAKSPLSLKIAHRQLTEGAQLRDFRENMMMEYRIANRLVRTQNFIEGVRAVLIDRDNSPKWDPQDLEAVSETLVDSFFAPLGEDELAFIQQRDA